MSRYNTIPSHGGERPLPYKQEVPSSSLGAPTTYPLKINAGKRPDPLPIENRGSKLEAQLLPEALMLPFWGLIYG